MRRLLWIRPRALVYHNEKESPDFCLSYRPVMEVGWNVKLPVDVCAIRRCYPTSPAEQDGRGPSFLRKTSDSHLAQQGRERWMRRLYLRRVIAAETNCGVDQGGQLYCLIHPAVWWSWSVAGGKLAKWAAVVVPRWSWNLGVFSALDSFTQILSASVSPLLS